MLIMNMIKLVTLIFCHFGFIKTILSTSNAGCVEQSLVGRNSLNIPNSSYTASTYYDHRYQPHNAKLYGKYGWSPANNNNPDDYLQIDLGIPRVITAVATQGNGGDPDNHQHAIKYEWVERYRLDYSNDLSRWISYKILEGNTDSNGVKHHDLSQSPIIARYIRFVPVTFHKAKTMRVDISVVNQEAPVVKAIPHQRSIQLGWTIQQCNITGPIMGFIIRNGSKDYDVSSSKKQYTLTGLKPYTDYDVRMLAKTQWGNGLWSETKRIKTDIAEPEESPQIVVLTTLSSQSILIQWKLEQPEKVHGPLKGFRITYTPQGGKPKTTDVVNVTAYNLTSLFKYTNYSITIAVSNTQYTGPPSKERRVRTTEDAPSAPVNVTGTLIPAQGSYGPRIVITWDRPRDPNGIIRKYTIVYFYSKDTSNKKTITISASAALTYSINVTRNGVLSYQISATTNKEGPYATGKDIKYGCPEQSLVGKERSLNIPDSSYAASSYYTRGKTDVRYAPHNAKLYGKRGWAPRHNSNPNNYLQIDLGFPRVIAAVATQGSGNNKEWVTKYKLSFATNNMTQWYSYEDEFGHSKLFKGNTDSHSVVRHELTNPQLARYIRFVPVEYMNHKTMRVNVYVTLQEPPRLTSIPNKRSIKLIWTYKKCSPTDYITGYVVKVGNRTHKVIGDDRSYTVTNLKPYTEYNISIKAIKQVGYGVWSNVTTIRTAIAEPELIPFLTRTEAISSEIVLLKWKVQNSELIHGPLKGYRITYTPQGGKPNTLDVGDVTAYNLTSLLKYTNYSITIAVSNIQYTGPPSKEQRVRTMEDVPSAPLNLNATLMHLQDSVTLRVVITWDRPRDPNGIIRKYTIVYYYNEDESKKTNFTINGTNDLKYVINTTRKGLLSYNVSATTIEEGPHAAGEILLVYTSFCESSDHLQQY